MTTSVRQEPAEGTNMTHYKNENEEVEDFRMQICESLKLHNTTALFKMRRVFNAMPVPPRAAITIENKKINALIGLALDILKYGDDFNRALELWLSNYFPGYESFQPKNDGIDHINCYSKAKTELGQLCSNLAHTPFVHPEDGAFESIEAYWYWLTFKASHDELRHLYGFEAKKAGARLKKETLKENIPHVPFFEKKIKQAILYKFEQNAHLAEILKESTLPLTHYYYWPGKNDDDAKIIYPGYSWITDYIDDIREYLNGRAFRLLIAGSRDIVDDALVEEAYHRLGIRAIEIISGMAKGVDKSAVVLSDKVQIPLCKMPADWDLHKKSAGYIRNQAMALRAGFALIIWDGKSKGTKHMIDICADENLPCKIIRV